MEKLCRIVLAAIIVSCNLYEAGRPRSFQTLSYAASLDPSLGIDIFAGTLVVAKGVIQHHNVVPNGL